MLPHGGADVDYAIAWEAISPADADYTIAWKAISSKPRITSFVG
jgi:hypothetical protein